MGIFNLIVRIVFFACLGWSVCVIIYAIIRRAIERRKAKKSLLEEDSVDEVSTTTENAVEESTKQSD